MSVSVATVLTACGIETPAIIVAVLDGIAVATVLTACGIETINYIDSFHSCFEVATVLTACGIETIKYRRLLFFSFTLQQYLPLAVLKPILS